MSVRRNYTALRAPHVYARMPPNVFQMASSDAGLLRWFYREISQDKVDVPSEGYIHLSECYVVNGRYLLDSDLNWVEETLVDWIVTEEAKHAVVQEIRGRGWEPANEAGTDWQYITFMSCNSENYGHYLCEAAPKMMHIARSGHKRVRFLVPEVCQQFVGFTTRFLAHLGITAEAVVVPSGWILFFRDILYFTPVSKHNFRKSETVLEFRHVALSFLSDTDRECRKLFITRAPGERHSVSNQAEIAGLLSERGFEAVYPGRMTVEEQVRLFSRADQLVGSVGAGMTNMLFCAEGARIFYISNALIDLFFWDIAGLCNLKFTWFFAEAPKAFDTLTFSSDYHVDPRELLAAWQRSMDVTRG
jgi:hypothetical protein